MKTSERITLGISAATFLATLMLAAVWLGELSNRISNVEKQVGYLQMGPRGASCQTIVQKLVQRPRDADLQRLADRWGCAEIPAAQVGPPPFPPAGTPPPLPPPPPAAESGP